MNCNFCPLPFVHLSTRVDGNVAPCCRSLDTVGNIKENSLEEIWNNEKMQKLRQQFINGERPPGCYPCWELEDQGGSSMRQNMLRPGSKRVGKLPANLAPVLDFDIPILELKLSNLCNFRCRTCKPDLSTTWLKDWDAVKEEYELIGMKYSTGRQENYKDDFLEDVVKLGPSLRIIEFAGGEPLMDPMHYKVLEALHPYAENITVKYSTNLSKLSYGKYNALDSWTKFKKVDISLSCDGYPELNEYIRTESNNAELEENLKQVRKELGEKFDGRVALCYSAWNAVGLTQSYEYFTNTLDMVVHGNIAWAPKFINPQVLPLELKESITQKYKQFLNYADSLNIEKFRKKQINRFLTTNMNYLNAVDKSNDFKQFIRYTQKLDVTRNTDIFKVIPELEKYV